MQKLGFTLLEILIVVVLLSSVFSGLLATIDPFEQFKKGRDTTVLTITNTIYEGFLRTSALNSSLFTNDLNGISLNSQEGLRLLNIVIDQGELKNNFISLAGQYLEQIYLTVRKEDNFVALCFQPQSKSFLTRSPAQYTQDSRYSPNCTNNCYFCVTNSQTPIVDTVSSTPPVQIPISLPQPTIVISPSPTLELPHDSVNHSLNVLYIQLNPVEGDKNLASEYFSWKWDGKKVEEFEQYIAQLNINTFKSLSAGRINYSIVKTLKIPNFPKYTNNFKFTISDYKNCSSNQKLSNGLTCESQKQMFDHNAFINDNTICELVNENNIDEIWLISSPYLTVWENWMIGPTSGYDVNGRAYVNTKCKKHVIVTGPVYDHTEPFTHIYGHRVEATMNYLSNKWSSDEKNKHIEQFMNMARYGMQYGINNPPYTKPGCGNAHFPLNALGHYGYWEKTYRDFNCPDWNNFPSYKGTTQNINCDAWGCTDDGWGSFWLGAIPHEPGETDIVFGSGKKVPFKKDWWYYLLYPDRSIQYVQQN